MEGVLGKERCKLVFILIFYWDKDITFSSGSKEHQGRHLSFRNMAHVPPERMGLGEGAVVERVVGEC